MGRYGKGLTLAFFLVSVFCHAEEAASRSEPQDYPLVARLDWRDPAFRQFITEVEANRRRVFLRDKSRNDPGRESAAAIAASLTLYRYVTGENDNIFSLAARCSIPYSTLASLNRLNHPEMVETGSTLLLPSVPGLFIPQEPQSDLEHLLAFRPEEDDSAMLAVGNTAGTTDTVYQFFPGGDFNATERAFFLNTGFFSPLRSYRHTSGYGIRQNPVTGNMRFHQGIDLAAPQGTEVYAAANGVVTEIGSDPVLGNYVVIMHRDKWASVYGHLQRIGTSLHTTVRSGTLIGWVGSTGQSTGPHLHFELRQNGTARDPDKYLFLPGGR